MRAKWESKWTKADTRRCLIGGVICSVRLRQGDGGWGYTVTRDGDGDVMRSSPCWGNNKREAQAAAGRYVAGLQGRYGADL